MPFQATRVKHVYLACWRTPELADGPVLVRETREAFDQAGKRILFMSIAPIDSPPPPDDLRKYMGEHVDEMLEYCTDLHIVIEGSGFLQSAKRMAMASVVLISGMRKRMFVHDSLEKARTALSPNDRETLDLAIRRAQADGVLVTHVKASGA